jgi:hypothetical protein
MSRGDILRRVALCMLLGVLLAWGMNEIAFLYLKSSFNRAPETIELVIPEGTAESVARGVEAPSIPENLSFVVGDTLLVTNLDSASHRLGPLWIPAGASARMVFSTPGSLAYVCSFQPDQYFGLEVHEPVTFGTRMLGVMTAGLPLGILIALYAIFAVPPRQSTPL